jgi:alanine-synthesizing transaminase
LFSRRTGWDLAPNALSSALASRRAAGGSVVDLTVTNPTAAALQHPPSLIAGVMDQVGSGYEPEPLGLTPARDQVAAYYRARGTACDTSAVFLTASTSEAFAYLLALCCDPGDAVLVPRPGYPLLDYLAALSGVRLIHYSFRYDGNWVLDRAELAERLRAESRVRAVFATSPANPTGAYLKRAELADLERVCAEHGLALVVDEVFADYPLREDPERAGSALGPRACLTFVLSGLSKVALLPQLKLSWGVACGPAGPVAAALGRLATIADSFLSVATPVQLALPRIFASAPAMQARVRARTAGNLTALRTAFAGGAASVLDAEGGWSAVLRLPALSGLDDEGWALALLEAGVLVQPGGLYDLDGCHAVVSLLCEPAPFAVGIAVLTREVARRAG